MMKRGNEQGPTSGEIMTTEEVAESFAKARASDRIVSVNVDQLVRRGHPIGAAHASRTETT